MSDSAIPWTVLPARLLCPWNSSGKNTGVGCHFLLQGIFPTQESNLGVSPALQADSLPLSCQGSYFQTDSRACKTENTVSFLLQKSCYLVTKLCLSIGSSVHGFSQARILKWAAISSSRDLTQLRNRTRVSCVSCIDRPLLYHRATREPLL